MITIKERSGIIYLQNCTLELPWCDFEYTSNGSKTYYFPLNQTTRNYFKEEIRPLIKSGEAIISSELYQTIRTFKQNPENENYLSNYISPPGITLKAHQHTAITNMLKYNKFGFFLGTGSGKTLIAITWLLNAKPSSALIVTPQKVVGQYKEELDKYIPGNNYIVTNYEQLNHYVNKEYEALILDESHRAKSFTSQINKNCREISRKCKYVYLFTGTPQDKARHEILAQLAILDSRVMQVKTKIFTRYFRLDDYYQPKQEIRERKQELTDLILSYTWGKETNKVIQLTKSNNYIIKCPHPSKLYDEMAQNRILEKNNSYCVADNKAILRLRLRQLCNGCVSYSNDDGDEIEETFPSTKMNNLTSLIQKINQAIIYYEFTASLIEIEGVLNKQNKTYVVVNGKCSAKKSAEYINQFKQGNVDYLVIQSRSGNAGLDLTNVNSIIFYSLPESYIVFHQCKARIDRIGQTKECNYYYLICEDSIEELIYESLGKKKSFTNQIFNQYDKEKQNERKNYSINYYK